MGCNEYFLVTLESVKTPVRHKFTNLTDEWYGPTGTKYTDSATINEIKKQATEQNRIGDSTIYQQLLTMYVQGQTISQGITDLKISVGNIKTDTDALKKSIAEVKADTTTLKADTTTLKTNIGDIKTVLDKINGEVV